MNIKKFTVSRDPNVYQAWPDLCLLPDGRMICIFSECTHHGNRDYTRIMLTESSDRGRRWSPKRPLTEGTEGLNYYYNNARISLLPDGVLYVTVDRIYGTTEDNTESRIVIYSSRDGGNTWSDGLETPARGIVPDKLFQLPSGRRLLACHYKSPESQKLVERLWYSDDDGCSWQGPVIVGQDPELNLCEASILRVDNTLVAFMRENSFAGRPCYKTFSHDNGMTWSTPIPFPLPGCHRPTSGFLQDGRIMITHRFFQGGVLKWGSSQNLFCGITDNESVLAPTYQKAFTQIFQIDHDFSPVGDTGYSGWVQFPDGEIYVVNYIMDEAEKAYIRGYSFSFYSSSEKKEATKPELSFATL